MSQHQQPVVRCGGDPGVPECTVQQRVVAESNSRVSCYQTDCRGGQAMRDVGDVRGGIMVARVVALDVQLLVTRRR